MVAEPYAGAWQRNDELTRDDITAQSAVYACVSLIARDIGKLRFKLTKLTEDGIWVETTSPAYSPVLRRPNHYQNHIQFKAWWITCLLLRGNCYVLKERDQRGVVIGLYILHPDRVTPLVAGNGEVYYRLQRDDLSLQPKYETVIPATEIIHARENCLYHPLVGTSALLACGIQAGAALRIQQDSSLFFENGARPGGILTAPGAISNETAARLKARWEAAYGGENSGKIAVLGDGLTFEPLRMTAVDSQLIEQLRWSAEVVCSVFHVPKYKIGLAEPAYGNLEEMNTDYYATCLQAPIEGMEVGLDEGLRVGESYGVELDIDGLMRMNPSALVKVAADGVKGSVMTPDESRRRLNLPRVEGGDTIYMQQQNYSLAALAKRDAQEDPFGSATAAPIPATTVDDPVEDAEFTDEDVEQALANLFDTSLGALTHETT